ncbi:PKD domain-containing protein [Ningiella sp. W23]|uniref:PKD domain-containing protein n=1 Tax=Ningiella sp. W23 TaxID=3023715 RepID=UPI0037570BBE
MRNIFIFVCLITLLNTTHAATSISLESDPGDWIGGGTPHFLEGDFTVSLSDSVISIQHDSGFDFLFVPPNNRILEPNVFLDAERAPFRGPLNPGMDVGSSGRGCNTIAGEFYIYELDFEGNNQKLAMDFVQYCDSNTSKLTGSIRIDSDVEVPYTQPIAVIRVGSQSIVEGQTVELNASSSFSSVSDITNYQWEKLVGPEFIFDATDTETVNASISDDIALGGEVIVVSLTVTDATGAQSTSDMTLDVKSKSDPMTFFTMSSESGDYIGAGMNWFYNENNSTISASRNYDNGVSLSINGSEFWSADFAAPDDAELENGVYENATRFPFQAPDVPGLTISGNGRGCNKNYGAFDVLDIVQQENTVTSFRATFEQHCESLSAPLLTGEIAFNSLDSNVPKANAGEDIEVLEGDVVNLNGSDSFDDTGSIVSYQWLTERDDVAFQGGNTSRANFTAPELGDRVKSDSLELTILVKDDEGYKAQDSVTVTVLQNNQAPVTSDDSIRVDIKGTVDISPLSNDSDEDGSLLLDSIEIVSQPAAGSLVISSQGVVTYTHTGDVSIDDTFTYTVKDNDGATSNVATVTVNAAESAPAPVTPPPPPAESSSGGGALQPLVSIGLLALVLIRRRRLYKR